MKSSEVKSNDEQYWTVCAMKVDAKETMKHETWICVSLVLAVELLRKKGDRVQLM